MGAEDTKPRKHPPTGPFAPPTPAEAEQTEGEPMAVANDKQTRQDESFHPTTASADQMAPDVARKYRDPNLQRGADAAEGSSTPHGRDVEARTDENRRREKPEGYSEVNEHGFRELEES